MPVAAGETWGVVAVAADELLELVSSAYEVLARRRAVGGCQLDNLLESCFGCAATTYCRPARYWVGEVR
jgi:hypothetical protein